MFLKEKLLLEPKLKARFVAGGRMQDRTVHSADETSSPSVSSSALYIVATIAAREGRKVRTMDIGSAYLNAEIKREVIMVIQPSLTKILCSIAPGYSKFMRED
jgi:dihydroxyacetone kinase DhaKLM complex PTS-EIIA-like component DhaM